MTVTLSIQWVKPNNESKIYDAYKKDAKKVFIVPVHGDTSLQDYRLFMEYIFRSVENLLTVLRNTYFRQMSRFSCCKILVFNWSQDITKIRGIFLGG